MCNPTGTSSSYTADPEQITRLRNQAADARSGCCTCTYRKSGVFRSTRKIRQLRGDGVTPNGQNDTDWTGEVFLSSDGTRGDVVVHHRVKAVNNTADTAAFPDTRAMTDADFQKRVERIPPAIERAWNGRAYKLKITDARCGERLFDVRFVVLLVDGGQHFTIKFVDVPGMGAYYEPNGISSGRSYISPPDRGKFNLGDNRTATDTVGDECLEPHEYGHMFGLKDEYIDVAANRGGAIYDFPDGSTEKAPDHNELMGVMVQKRPRPTRYCITIAYAAIALLEANGCAVTDCQIL